MSRREFLRWALTKHDDAALRNLLSKHGEHVNKRTAARVAGGEDDAGSLSCCRLHYLLHLCCLPHDANVAQIVQDRSEAQPANVPRRNQQDCQLAGTPNFAVMDVNALSLKHQGHPSCVNLCPLPRLPYLHNAPICCLVTLHWSV